MPDISPFLDCPREKEDGRALWRFDVFHARFQTWIDRVVRRFSGRQKPLATVRYGRSCPLEDEALRMANQFREGCVQWELSERLPKGRRISCWYK